MTRLIVGLAALALLLGGCGASATTQQTATPSPSSVSPSPPPLSAHPTIAPDTCTAANGLPDPTCTPGAINADVTQATIHSTICVQGWTNTVRPPVTWSEPLKYKLMRAYGYYAGRSARAYELDHLIPLELGGSPRDIANLWPETPPTPNPKDGVEHAAKRAVCSGKMTLADARTQIAKNWKRLAVTLHVKL